MYHHLQPTIREGDLCPENKTTQGYRKQDNLKHMIKPIILLSVLFVSIALSLQCDKKKEIKQNKAVFQTETVPKADISAGQSSVIGRNLPNAAHKIVKQPGDTAIEDKGQNDTLASEEYSDWDSLCTDFSEPNIRENSFKLLENFAFGRYDYINETNFEYNNNELLSAAVCASGTDHYKKLIRKNIEQIKSGDSDDFNWARDIYFRRLSMEFLKKHKQVRSFLAKNLDILDSDYWTVNPLWDFKKNIPFWLYRFEDGSIQQFEKIMLKTAKIAQEGDEVVFPDTANDSNTGKPVFFTPSGLYCDPSAGCLFDKRNELILSYLVEFFAIEYGISSLEKSAYTKDFKINKPTKDTDDLRGEIIDSALLDTLMNLKSVYFRRELDYFGLVRENDENYIWKKIALKPRLQVEFVISCQTIVILKLGVSTTDNDSVLLFSGLPCGSTGVPSGYTQFGSPFTIELTLPCTECDTSNLYSMYSDTAWEWNVNRPDKHIKRLFAAGWHGHYDGRHLDRIELFIEDEKGTRIKLDEHGFCGHMWCKNAYMSNPFLTDANGDGLTDIIIEASDNEKFLYLQLPTGGFEKHIIQSYATHRSGGC